MKPNGQIFIPKRKKGESKEIVATFELKGNTIRSTSEYWLSNQITLNVIEEKL